jgi:hypothetical protein
MKFEVLALDYDGTIATDGILNPEVNSALADLRNRGITVVLVTGRILSDLKRVAGDLRCFDAVVAENGAVIAFPNGHTRLIGHPPPPNFLDELRRRAIDFVAGQCVIETDAAFAQPILGAIRDLEMPLVLVFNRSRLMVLPQAVSKATGLRAVLMALRLSPHNAIAIGDAENDHDLLAACEMAVAVGWGSEALKKGADVVLPGSGPQAVAPYIRMATDRTRLPPDRIGRGHITLGTLSDGNPITLPVRGLNVLVAGDPRSGKSWGVGLACEQLILQGYCICVVDPEGDYGELEALPGVVAFGDDEDPPSLRDLDRVLRHPDMSAVVNLCRMPYREKVTYLRSVLPELASLRRRTGLPHRIVIDEAHYFLHEAKAKELLDLDLGAYTLVTYRLCDIHPDLLKTIGIVIVNRMTDAQEILKLQEISGHNTTSSNWSEVLGSLGMNEACLLPGSSGARGDLRKFTLLPRLTVHVRHRSKYLDVPVAEGCGFVFTLNGKALRPPARTMQDFMAALQDVPDPALAEHAGRGDFSRWVADVFRDHLLSSDLSKIEQRSRFGRLGNLRAALCDAIKARYEVDSEMVW